MKSPPSILDRHLGWRSLDPTLDISSDFVKKKKAFRLLFSSIASFSIQKDATFLLVQTWLNLAQLVSTRLNFTQLDSTRLNFAQLSSTRLNWTQLGSTRLNLAQLGSISFHLLCCISRNVARVPKGSQRLPKSVFLFFPF